MSCEFHLRKSLMCKTQCTIVQYVYACENKSITLQRHIVLTIFITDVKCFALHKIIRDKTKIKHCALNGELYVL